MRIGILTFHRAHNYGAVLQCYALQKVLATMGHDAVVIDYRQPYVESQYASFNWQYFLDQLVNFRLLTMLRYFAKVRKNVIRAAVFRRFRNRHLSVSSKCGSGQIPLYDCYVIGSDQVWSLHCTKYADDVYWGQFARPAKSKIIGYAISSTIESLLQIGGEKVKKHLHDFSAVSFREEAIRNQVASMAGVKGEMALDPTLLFTADCWHGLTENVPVQPSVVVYHAQFRYASQNVRREVDEKARQLARSLDCGVIDLSNCITSPEYFVAAFKQARYVITNSFHGVALALTFNKPMYAILCHDSLDERYKRLLAAVGGDAMLVDTDFVPVAKPVDYEPINVALAKLRSHSIDFLQHNI